MIITLINKKIIPKNKANISVLSDSFARGYGIFETLRTFDNKKLFKADEHLKRLFESAKKIDLKIKYNPEEVLEMLQKVTKKSPHKLQRIKVIAVKEGIIITSTPFKDNKKIYKGISLMSIQSSRSLPEIKSISYLPSALAHAKAAKKGFYDALLIDKKYEIYEGAYCNILWFEENTLCTRNDKILKGITRKAVLEISPYKIKFKRVKLKELTKKEEIFLTQSTRGIVPVTKIDKHKIGNGQPGEKTNKLIQILSNRIKSNIN